MKNALYALLVLCAFSLPALAQHNYEFGGGYAHVSGNGGLDGFTVATAYSPIPDFQLFLNYDGVFDHTTFGIFAFTQTGLTFVNSHAEGLMTGPRFFVPGLLKGHGNIKGHTLHPFIEAGFGDYKLHSSVTQVSTGTTSAEDRAFAWMIGGGGDFVAYRNFSARINLDLLRTHWVNEGQSHLRLTLGVFWSRHPRTE